MKFYWSAFLLGTLLLALAGCGGEQFGTAPQSIPSAPDAVVAFQQASCSEHTEIRPNVDILYVVDNSGSTNTLTNDIRTSIQNTIGSISNQFDYRVIATPLLETADGNNDYQVLSKSATSLPASIPTTKILTTASQFTLFSTPVRGRQEAGLSRVQNFIANHQSDLFRQQAYLFVVLVSNGRDTEVEYLVNGETVTRQNVDVFNQRKQAFLTIKQYLQSQQFRIFSVTANTACRDGYISSEKSYAAMSKALYNEQPGLEASSTSDHYDLCGPTVSAIFADVNAKIKQIIIPHKYKYWPITFSETATGLNVSEIKVYKSSPTQSPSLLPPASWTYIDNVNRDSYNTRIEPTPGEPSNARHMIQFTTGNEVVYPECIQVTSTSNQEYFGFVVIPKVPKPESIVLKINKRVIPASDSNGYSLIGQQYNKNIKVAYKGFLDTPTVLRTGFMLQLNGETNYYKSGDNVEIYYVPKSN